MANDVRWALRDEGDPELQAFIQAHPDLNLRRIEWDDELTVWFFDSLDPWSVSEFVRGSPTRQLLGQLEQTLRGAP